MPTPVTYKDLPRRTVENRLNKLKKAVEDARDNKGRVKVSQLRANLDPAPEGLDKALAALEQHVKTRRTRQISDGCGGTTSRTRMVVPSLISKTKTNSILDAILTAKKDVLDAVDTDGNKRLDEEEIVAAKGKRSGPFAKLEGKFVKALLNAHHTKNSQAQNQWVRQMEGLRASITERCSADEDIGYVAQEQAKTSLGAEALTWALRDLVTIGGADLHTAARVLKTADIELLSEIVDIRDSSIRNREDNLSNKDIARLLGVRSLRTYVKDKKADLDARVGGDYEDHYLAGHDLAKPADLAAYDDWLTQYNAVSTSC